MAGEKRSQETEEPQRTENIILVDIEGTTTSISFVKETLFPYVREHLKEYIEKNWENAEFKEDLEKLKEQAKKDETDKVEGLIPITSGTPDEEKETVMKNIQWQMDNDRKSSALKQLQGHMWREAYNSGAVKGHVYEDVPKALDEWTSSGKKIYVYSSGSVEAQKLLFGHSTHGDLLKHFTDYFDTEVGAKQESSSYKTIATKINADASKILFLTDIPSEAKAAIEAGLSSVLVVRDGNEPLSADEKSKYTTIKTFLDLSFQSSAKRQKVEETKEPPAKKEEEKKEEKKIEKKTEEVEDVEMKDVSDKKAEKVEEKNETDKSKAPEEKEKPKETPEPEKSPEKSPAVDKEPEEPKKPEEPEKMDVEKEVKSKDEDKGEKIDDKLTEIKETKEIKEIKETKTDEVKTDDKKTKTEEIKQDNETVKEKIDDKKTVDEESKQIDEKIEKVDDKKEEKAEEKENGDQVKQNGDKKSSETIEEKKIVKEINGETKKEEENKEEEKKEKKEGGEEEKKKEEEENKEESEKKVNGNTDDEHRISDEKNKTTSNKNGESSDDKESIKVKKVVDSIVDGAGETEVVTPVAVVAATS